MAEFQYRRIDRKFLGELSQEVAAGRSCFILGPRYSGKSYLMARLRSYLRKRDLGPLIYRRLGRDAEVSGEAQAREMFRSAVAEILPEAAETCADSALIEPVVRLSQYVEGPVVVLLANAEKMPVHVTQRLLGELRTQAEAGRVITVLSGEYDFCDVVHQPHGEAWPAHHFVVQGYEEKQFRELAVEYARASCVCFESADEALELLWRETGGNDYLLRRLIGASLETRVRERVSDRKPISTAEIQSSLRAAASRGSSTAEVLRYWMRLVDCEPSCWTDLEKLRYGKRVEVSAENGPPSPLEFAGVAVRDGVRLSFASSLVERLVRKQYNHRQFGDLFARNGDWKGAFERYARLEPEEMIRPSDLEDRAEVLATVAALCAALPAEASRGVRRVNRLFSKGCRYLLGFQHVTFWVLRRGRDWSHQDWEGWTSPDAPLKELAALLPSDLSLVSGPIPSKVAFGQYALLRQFKDFERGAVIVSSRADDRGCIQRMELLSQLLASFVAAHSYAIELEEKQIRLEIRNKHAEIVNSIVDRLGSAVLNIKDVLIHAARELRENLGYSRVIFWLVSPARQCIREVPDSLGLTVPKSLLLDEHQQDRRVRVALSGKHEVIVEKGVPESLIIPLLKDTPSAIGVMEVERADGCVCDEEAQDLVVFGRQLTRAIRQAERCHMMQSALNLIPEPVAIVDRLGMVCFANQPAAELLDVRTHWRDPDDAEHIASGSLTKCIEAALTGQRVVQRFNGIGKYEHYRGEVLCDSINNGRGEAVGALIHICDVRYPEKIFEAFRLVASADGTSSAMQSLLEATKQLGHKWGRLYLIDERDSSRLVSKLSFGMSHENEIMFNRGGVELSRREEFGEAWLGERPPQVFCYDPELKDSKEKRTRFGLVATIVKEPDCGSLARRHADDSCPTFLRKQPHEFWMDIPLLTSEGPLGKLSLQCDEEMRPEQFELLTLLVSHTAMLLDVFLSREREVQQRDEDIRLAREKATSVITHNITSRIGSLSVLLARYKRLATTRPELRSITDSFEHVLEGTLGTLRRTKGLAGPITLRPTAFNLVESFQRALAAALFEQQWVLESVPEVPVIADCHLLEGALAELLQNSRDFAPDIDRMRVSVLIEVVWRASDERVKIIYEDNGPGIAEDLKKRVFEDFFSWRPGRKSGTGLGLGSVRRAIEAHGGTVSETGAPGDGVRFIMDIPRYLRRVEVEEADNGSLSSYALSFSNR
jgi:signal transduction histidine kinase/PAS domain-containing protein